MFFATCKPLFLRTGHYDAFHKRALGKQVEDDQRDAAHQHADGDQLLLTAHGHDDGLGGVRGEVAAHAADDGGKLGGVDGHAGEEVAGVEQIRPLPHEGEQEAAGDGGHGVGQHDAQERMHRAAAVHIRSLLQRLGNACEVLTQHVDVQAVFQSHTGQCHQDIGCDAGTQIDGFPGKKGNESRSGSVKNALNPLAEGEPLRIYAEQRKNPQNIKIRLCRR